MYDCLRSLLYNCMRYINGIWFLGICNVMEWTRDMGHTRIIVLLKEVEDFVMGLRVSGNVEVLCDTNVEK